MNCPLCSKTVSQQGMNKHIFSKSHEVQLATLVQENKSMIIKYIKNYKLGVNTLPWVYHSKNRNIHLNLCFGCKSAYVSDYYKKHECSDFQKGVKSLEAMLPAVPPSEPPTPPPSIDNSALQDKITALETKISSLKQERDKFMRLSDSAIDYKDSLIFVLEKLREENYTKYEECMIGIKDYADVFSQMCERLGSNEIDFEEARPSEEED